jgi:chemotaxis protein methyltransferase CheR
MGLEDKLALESPELAGIQLVLLRACGVSLSAGLRRTLRSGILSAAAALGEDPEQLVERILAEEPEAVAALIEHSVVGESYFYRHPEQFAALEREAWGRPEPLQIWCAGCASGEEPYSLAMALLEAGRAGRGDRILATDVSESALRRAREASYGARSLRRLSPGLRSRWFRGEQPPLEVVPEVRSLVHFQRHNLLAEPAPGEFDLVVCRNVLIYFEPDTAAHVLERLVEAVRPGGHLVLGPVELPLAARLALEWVGVYGASILRKPAERGTPTSPSGADGDPPSPRERSR